MAYHGTGSDGLYRGMASGLAKWIDALANGEDATLETVIITDLTVATGANLPAFDVLNVNAGGTSNLATVISGVWEASTIGEIYGGTGQSSYSAGDLLYSDATDSLATLASGNEGEIFRVSGGALSWSALLEETYGGTGQSTYNQGDILYSDATDSLTALASGSAGQILSIGGSIQWVDHTIAPYTVTTATANPYTISNGDDAILTSGTLGLHLPATPEAIGQRHIIKDRLGNAGSANVTVSGSPDGLTLIDGAATQTISTNWGSLNVFWDGVQWNTI